MNTIRDWTAIGLRFIAVPFIFMAVGVLLIPIALENLGAFIAASKSGRMWSYLKVTRGTR